MNNKEKNSSRVFIKTYETVDEAREAVGRLFKAQDDFDVEAMCERHENVIKIVLHPQPTQLVDGEVNTANADFIAAIGVLGFVEERSKILAVPEYATNANERYREKQYVKSFKAREEAMNYTNNFRGAQEALGADFLLSQRAEKVYLGMTSAQAKVLFKIKEENITLEEFFMREGFLPTQMRGVDYTKNNTNPFGRK